MTDFITQIAPDLSWIIEVCTPEMRQEIECNCTLVVVKDQFNIKSKSYNSYFDDVGLNWKDDDEHFTFSSSTYGLSEKDIIKMMRKIMGDKLNGF